MPAWPDDEARAFAQDFARVYLSWAPRDPDGYARALVPFVAPELQSSVVPELAKGSAADGRARDRRAHGRGR